MIPGMIEKWILIVAMVLISFIAGEIHGCSRAGQQYKEAETKFITKTVTLLQVEKKEVPVFKTQIQTIDKIVEKIVYEASKEIPNPVVCDFSPSRVRRINEISTNYSTSLSGTL